MTRHGELASETGFGLRPVSVARTHIGLVREVNEDRLLDAPHKGLWAVADGMGGLSLGDEAAAFVIRLLAGLVNEPEPISIKAITDALDRANSGILELAARTGKMCGSTVAGMHIGSTGCTIFWAGDSRVYRLRAGILERLTRDHRFVQDLVDAHVIDEAHARYHPQASVITRALGIEPDCSVETIGCEPRTEDIYLVASDGLTDLLDDAALARILAMNLTASADALVTEAIAAGATDNVSFVVIHLEAQLNHPPN